MNSKQCHQELPPDALLIHKITEHCWAVVKTYN